MLVPPLEVMRPRPVDQVPLAGALPGGTQYTPKLDGFRCLAFALEDGVVLQSRSGRPLEGDFPRIAAATAETVPAGTILDGELCAWVDGRLAFEQLLRTRAARERDHVALSFAVFDVLAVPGRDVRPLPLEQRWELLSDLLADGRPPVQQLMATTDYDQALRWWTDMTPTGVEGLVCRGLATPYRPARPGAAAWIKVRHSDTTNVHILALAHPPHRPPAVLLRLPDGRQMWSSPQLSPAQRRYVGDAAAGLTAAPEPDADHQQRHPLRAPLLAEARVTTGRHPTARFVRLRAQP